MRTRLAARIDSAIEARALSGQSHVCAKTPPRRERGTNPNSPGDAQNTAGSLRSRRISVPFPWGSRFVWAASTVVVPPVTFLQTAHPSVRIHARYSRLLSGPRLGWNRFLRTGALRFGGRPRGNGTLRRKGTRLQHNHLDSVFSWRKRPAQDAAMASEPGVICLQRGDAGQDDRTRPANSCSQCFQKLQCFWLHSMDCRFGQYIPVPMAFCAIGYRTRVARMSGLLTV